LYSTDLGSVSGPAVEKLAKQHRVSKSEVIRRAVNIAYTFDLFAKWDRIEKQMVSAPRVKRGPQPATMEEKAVIAQYRSTYGYAGRIHTAAILSCIRSLVKQGITEAEITALVMVSKQDVWIAGRILRGEHVPLNEILSDKMVNRLLPLLENTEQAEVEMAGIKLEGTIKPKAFAYLKRILPTEQLSAAWDDIQEAKAGSEIRDIVTAYAKTVDDVPAAYARTVGDE
jgi:hypothetical protein